MYSIRLINVNKVYNPESDVPFQALSNISFDVKKGEFVAIIGPSGSGKSTLMNILGLLDHPTSGTYELDGLDVSRLKPDQAAEIRNKKLGFIFQSFNLLTRTKAIENVALPLIYSKVPKAERLKRAGESLVKVGLEQKINSHPNQLSGGQQQRVAIARALVTNPEVILADEPTGNLDTTTGDEVMKIFKELNKEGKTIVLITHEPDIAAHAKRVITVKDGRILEKK